MRTDHTPPLGLVLIRVVCGIIAVSAGLEWWRDAHFDRRAMELALRAGIKHRGALGTWWGESVLLVNPDAALFLWKTMVLTAGVSFLTGALVRPIGTLAAFFLVQAAFYGPTDSSTLAFLLATCFAGCALSHAGRGLGCDIVLDETLPSWVTWTKPRRRGLF